MGLAPTDQSLVPFRTRPVDLKVVAPKQPVGQDRNAETG